MSRNGPLAPEAAEHIAASLDAAGLRRGDREDVAEELSAHIADGLESGRSLEDLLREFGASATTGALIGRSVRRRRRARQPLLRAALVFTFGAAAIYAAVFARLHSRGPERPFESPSAAAKAWRATSVNTSADERAAFETVLASMYTEGEDGRLTAAGLRAFQAWKGKTDPSVWSKLLEPAYFPNAARRGEVLREFERFLRLSRDGSSRAFEIERDALLGDPGRALRFVALQVPLARLSAARAARRTP